MTQDQLKSDRIIQDDSEGNSSDQVLFNISEKKRLVMEELKKAIRESSIDCSLNIMDTRDPDDPDGFECMSDQDQMMTVSYHMFLIFSRTKMIQT